MKTAMQTIMKMAVAPAAMPSTASCGRPSDPPSSGGGGRRRERGRGDEIIRREEEKGALVNT